MPGDNVGKLADAAPKTRGALARPELFDCLQRAREWPVIFLSAPPGSGKTMLVAGFLRRFKINHIWLTVEDSRGNDHEALLDAFIESMQQCICEGEECVAVIDNYHYWQSFDVAHQKLDKLINSLEEGVNLVLISRLDLPHAFDAQVQANSIIRFFSGDIYFTRDEGVKLIKHMAPAPSKRIEDAQSVAESVWSLTAGWCLGTQVLVGEVVKGTSGDVNIYRRISDGSELIYYYFDRQLLVDVHEDSLNKLLQLCALDYVPKEIFDDCFGYENADQQVVSQYHLFLNFFSLVKRNAHDYLHLLPLFNRYLAYRESLVPQENTQERHRAFGKLLLDQGYACEAITFYLNKQLWPDASESMNSAYMTCINQAKINNMGNIFENLPHSSIDHHPWIKYWDLWSRRNVGMATHLTDWYSVYEKFDGVDAEGRLFSAFCIADMLGPFARYDKRLSHLEAELSEYIQTATGKIDERAIFSALRLALWSSAEKQALDDLVARGENIVRSNCDVNLRIKLGATLVHYFSWWRGDTSKASVLYDFIAKDVESPHVERYSKLFWHANVSIHAWLIGDNHKAKLHLQGAVEALTSADDESWRRLIFFHSAFVHFSEGDNETALGYADQVFSPKECDTPLARALYLYLKAWLKYGEQRLEDLIEHLEQAVDVLSKQEGHALYRAMIEVDYGRALYLNNDSFHAERMIERVDKCALKTGSLTLRYRCSLARLSANVSEFPDQNEAQRLRSVLAVAREQNLMRLAWWRSPSLRRTYKAALIAGVEVDAVAAQIKENNIELDRSCFEVENWPWPIKLYTLGRFSLVVNGRKYEFNGRGKSRPLELIKTLIALGGRDVSEQSLSDVLWPNSEADSAHRNFDTTLHRLRKIFELDEVLVLKDGRLTLNNCYCWVDVWVFERLIGRLDRELRQNKSQVDEAVVIGTFDKLAEIYRGGFLINEEGNQAIMGYRAKLRNRWSRILKEVGGFWMLRGNNERASEVFQTGIETDATQEAFYRELMRVFERQKNWSGAVNTFRDCQRVLSTELGVEPSEDTYKIYRRLSQTKTQINE